MTPLLAVFLAGLLFGFALTTMFRDLAWERINREQQDRGDYWFDRCQQIIKEAHDEPWKEA